MKDFADISFFIEDQFPSIYKEDGDVLIQFVKAYYEFVDINYKKNRNALNEIDIDYTSEEFLDYFKKTYLSDFPYISASDQRFAIKHIVDYFRTKGTIESTKLLIRLLFGQESEVILPSNFVLKPSDSDWFLPRYIEVSRSPLSITFLNKEIIGSKSRAKAIVEGLVTKRVNGKFIDVLYLSSIRGFFVKGDIITADGNLQNAPKVLGSLNSIAIENGGRNNSIGDVFDVISESGKGAKARVTAILDQTGRVDFDLVEGGSGYTLTNTTDIYVSDAVINLDNENLDFIRFERISQKLEDLKLLSVTDILPITEPGVFLIGVNSSGQQVANGTILEYSTNVEGGNDVLNVKLLVTSGTFDRQESIELTNDVSFLEGETVEEESSIDLEVSSSSGTFNIGDKVIQATEVLYDSLTANLTLTSPANIFELRETVAQYNANNELAVTAQVININGDILKVNNIRSFSTPGEFVENIELVGLSSAASANVLTANVSTSTTLYTGYSFGFVDSANSSFISLKPAWGTFEANKVIKSFSNTDISLLSEQGSAVTSSVDVVSQGARGTISSQPTANSVVIENIFGDFTVSNEILGLSSRKVAMVSAIYNDGATDVWVSGNSAANGLIDIVANTSPSAIIIAQNTSAIGVHGNTQPFFSSGQVSIEGSSREILSVNVNSNIALITTNTDHVFEVGDNVFLEITLQQNNEVKIISGIYEILTVPNLDEITVEFDEVDSNIILGGNYAIFTSVIRKTVITPIETNRVELISPPRSSNGDIIEIFRNVISVSQGENANFTIGSLEDEEVVFLATDFIGGVNVAGVPYTNINIDGSNSGVGFVNGLVIDQPGTGYSNNQVITFSGGGFAGGDPLVPASATLFTDGSGQLVDVVMTNHGQGYWSEPTINWGGNTTANVEIVMDYGYGFPLSPNGDSDTTLIDTWTYEPFEIGRISSLSGINPGQDYNQDPFVLVYNRYIAGYRRSDVLISIENTVGTFLKGEVITETIPGDGGSFEIAKGYILVATPTQLIVRRTSFNTAFTGNYEIVGSTSNATANVSSIETIEGSFVMGDNAEIDATVISASGIASEVEIIDSGIGYEDGTPVTLVRDGFQFVMNGVGDSQTQGVGTGFWKTKTSHLNSETKIHDNFYYQEFSYDVISGKSLDRYETVLKNILHVTGTKLFGTVEKRSDFAEVLTSNSKFETFPSEPLIDLDFTSALLDERITFTRASTATYFDANGVMQTAAVDEPAFDHDPVTGQPLGLAVWGQSTNLLLWSELLSTSPTWSGVQRNVLPATFGPAAIPVWRIEETTETDIHNLTQNAVSTVGARYAFQAKLAPGERTFAFFGFNGGGVTAFASINLQTGEVATVVNAGGGSPIFWARPLRDGAWQVFGTVTATTTASLVVDVRISADGVWANRFYTGDGTSGIYVWHPQLEASAFPTPYIKTEGSTATRIADRVTMTGTAFSDWFNPVEGTFVVTAQPQNLVSETTRIAAISDGTANNSIRANAAGLSVFVNSGGVTQAEFALSWTQGAFNTWGIAYKENDICGAINGVVGTTDTSATIPAVNQLEIGRLANGTSGSRLSGYIQSIRYWPTRLSNTRLQELTS